MIVFEKIRWKNFLSTGDKFTEIWLNRSPSTLIVGQNGAGKSTLLDAIAFGLFGSPHRDIKKAQLINSINGKKAVVEVEFSIGKQQFKIVRGIKPNIFEIWQNGNQINQDSNARDFQKFLEQNILKLNHKSFHQIVVLGSSSFIPFMQLPNNHRREVIEDLLDINIFSKMNTILKERAGIIREKLKDLDYQLDLIKDKIKVQKQYIVDVKELSNDRLQEKHAQVQALLQEISNLQTENGNLSLFVEEHQEKAIAARDKYESDKTEVESFRNEFRRQIKSLVKDAKFYDENATCPSCAQEISADLRTAKIDEAKTRAKELNEALSKADAKAEQIQEALTTVLQQIGEVTDKQTEINTNNRTITRCQTDITKIEDSIAEMQGNSSDVAQAEEVLEQLTADKDTYTEQKLQQLDRRAYYEAISEMLKDSGIKTKVIKQYLPVMNKLINHYLQVLDFFVSFHLDENFTETIRSRHRDDFNYASFSEGEKQRIDLALMFTWRQIARMKNSAATNLLILDETFDSSLDNDGIDNLFKILETLDNNSNVFIISHKGDVLESKFRNRLEFIKEHNFSVIKR